MHRLVVFTSTITTFSLWTYDDHFITESDVRIKAGRLGAEDSTLYRADIWSPIDFALGSLQARLSGGMTRELQRPSRRLAPLISAPRRYVLVGEWIAKSNVSKRLG
jgi:hypothetical protein